MDDTEFLRNLARAAREEGAEERDRWERWDRLTDGMLSPEEEAELRETAESSPEAEQAYQAFRPLSAEFRAKMFAEIGPMIRPPASFFDRLRAIFIRWIAAFAAVGGWRAAVAGPALAAAAAAVYFLIHPPELQPIPEMTITQFVSTILTVRGVEGPILSPGGTYKAVVQAEARVTLVPACYVQVGSSIPPRLRTVSCTISKRLGYGTEITGTLPGDLPIGPATVWTVMGYPEQLPTVEKIANLPPGKPFRDRWWAALPQSIEVRAP